MAPTHVALVPYEQELVPIEELLHVASALQTQVSRDLGPLWGLWGVVSPFSRLDDVPPTYSPLVIVAGLPKPWHGFHLDSSGGPLALIGYQKGWSLLASHELLELLCDPHGDRTRREVSLKSGQGEVDYLVEVCDPCQYENYLIGDVHVSDFVTPEYYGPLGVTGGRFSFTRSVASPLAVCDGGILTWRTSGGRIWQKSGADEPQPLQTGKLSRASVGSYGDDVPTDITERLSQPYRSAEPYYGPERARQRYSAELRQSIDRILDQLGVKRPSSKVEAIVRLLEDLAMEGSQARDDFLADPPGTLRRYEIPPPPNPQNLTLAPAEHYHGVLAALKGGSGFGDQELITWLSTHGVLMHAGIE